MDICNISWTFVIFLWTIGIFCGNLVYFSRFGILYQEKSGNPIGSNSTNDLFCLESQFSLSHSGHIFCSEARNFILG
jgi:hypothetical protein